MSTLDGVFTLRTPRDLLEKLEADFVRLASSEATTKAAQYAAFDFFVCALHLADWQHKATGASLNACQSYPDGALVRHVANGAKHFAVSTARHATVRDTRVSAGAFQQAAFQPDAFATSSKLVIQLEDGRTEDAMVVAGRVLSHWRAAVR
jgi:hypothetical protein